MSLHAPCRAGRLSRARSNHPASRADWRHAGLLLASGCPTAVSGQMRFPSIGLARVGAPAVSSRSPFVTEWPRRGTVPSERPRPGPKRSGCLSQILRLFRRFCLTRPGSVVIRYTVFGKRGKSQSLVEVGAGQVKKALWRVNRKETGRCVRAGISSSHWCSG